MAKLKVTKTDRIGFKAGFTRKDEAVTHAKKLEKSIKRYGHVTVEKVDFNRGDGKTKHGYAVFWNPIKRLF